MTGNLKTALRGQIYYTVYGTNSDGVRRAWVIQSEARARRAYLKLCNANGWTCQGLTCVPRDRSGGV